MNFQDAVDKYLKRNNYAALELKTVLFDMDGVLFNSMPAHAKSWVEAMKYHGLPFTEYEGYLNEGRTCRTTVDYGFNKALNRNATDEEVDKIYKMKTALFESYPQAECIPYTSELTRQIKNQNLDRLIVTGSGQRSLWAMIDDNYPGIFDTSRMITSFDVKFGKPHPEPYLMGLKRAGVQPWQAVIIENAPLGVQAGVAAGVFTIAVQTGILDEDVLHDAGADLVFSSMKDLSENWKTFSEPLISGH
jgi:beta-phosphoglucomutase-like phosphatase (HAD superfamily)